MSFNHRHFTAIIDFNIGRFLWFAYTIVMFRNINKLDMFLLIYNIDKWYTNVNIMHTIYVNMCIFIYWQVIYEHSMHMIYVNICVCTQMCMNIHMCMYIDVYEYWYAYVHVLISDTIYVNIHVYVYRCVWISMNIDVYVNRFVWIFIYWSP
jgi:hypothetical protein